MRTRTGTVVAAAVIIVVGFAFGALLAVLARGSSDRTQPVAVAAKPRIAVATMPPRTAAPTMIAQATATPVPTTPPTPSTPPTPARTGSPSPAIRTVTARQAAAAPADARMLRGSWQVDEANVQVGRIVWVGAAEPSGADTIVLDAHKESVGGRSAMPCERQTILHAAFSVGAAQQSVPYRETNCQGVVSTGEVRVSSFSPDGSFTGSFWQNGTMLGNFQARKR
jgi:hypothetical protein